MGAKYSHVSAAHRRLQFAHAKKKNANAVAIEQARLDFEAAMKRIMTPAAMFQHLDCDEASLVERWEVLRFLKREAAAIQAQTTAALQSPSGLSEQAQQQASELMHKVKQIWLRLDKPPKLAVLLTSGPPLMMPAEKRASHGATSSGLASTANGSGATSSAIGASSTLSPTSAGASAVPNLNLTKLATTRPSTSSHSTAAHSSAAAAAAAASSFSFSSSSSSSMHDDSTRDISTQLSREELVALFRDFTNEEIDQLIRNALARSKLLHPPIPSASTLHTRPSTHQTRLKDLFRWLFDSLDTERVGVLTGEQIRGWLVGPQPGVGGRSQRNELLVAPPTSRVSSAVRILTNKLQGHAVYTKPDFENFFRAWSEDDLVEVSRELKITSMAEVEAFQREVRTFHALTRRVDTVALASARGQEKIDERRRIHQAHQAIHTHGAAAAAAATATGAGAGSGAGHHANGHGPHPIGTHGAGGASNAPMSTTSAAHPPTDALLPSSALGLDALSSSIAALLSDKDRRALEDGERERKESQAKADVKRREERETRDAEEKKRRVVADAEIVRARERSRLRQQDWQRESQASESDLHAFVAGVQAMLGRSEGKLGSIEVDHLFRLQDAHGISRRVAVDLLHQRVGVSVHQLNQQLAATIPDLEPICAGCLLHSSTHITRECGHVCYCDRCADELMSLPPHLRRCLVCKQPVSSLIKCTYQHWTR